MSVSKIRCNLDKIVDYVPVLSVVNNLVDLVQKRIFKGNSKPKSEYHEFIINKSSKICLVYMLPFAKIAHEIGKAIFRKKQSDEPLHSKSEIHSQTPEPEGDTGLPWSTLGPMLAKGIQTEEAALDAIKKTPHIFELLSEDLRNNEKIALAAFKINEAAVIHALGARLLANRDFVLQINGLSKEGVILSDLSKELRNDEEVVLEVVKKDGRNLKGASERLKDNDDVVRAAVESNGLAIEYASERLRALKEINLLAVKSNPWAFEVLNSEFSSDVDIAIAAIENLPEVYTVMGENLKNNPRIIETLRKYLK